MKKKNSILLVEDDVNISSLIQELLEAHDFKVTHVKNGLKALEILKEENFDLILLDEMMPIMKGSEFLVRVKAGNTNFNTPIIMITSVQDDSHQVNVLREGADDYIQKPFKFDVLLARIELALKKAKTSLDKYIEISNEATPHLLTAREKDVIALIIKGLNNSEMAHELCISESTVSNHLQNIFSKLKVNSRTQAAIVALRYSVLD